MGTQGEGGREAARHEAQEAQEARQARQAGAEGCRMKHTPRSPELKADVTRRINRIIGQLNGVKAMVEDERYCGDVLTQLAAVESAVKSVSRVVMRDHLHSCVVERVQSGDTEVVDEVMDLLKKFS